MSSHPAEARARGLSAGQVSEWLHADHGAPWKRDAGGGVDPTQGGIGGATPSPGTMNPMMQGMVQRYASMSPEQLQELAARTAGTQQGQIIQSVLRQKQMQPNAQAAARGGVLHRGFGGQMGISELDPGWTRNAMSQMATGYLHGDTLGRADALKTTAPGGAYVIPADVVAGLGEGNNLAGARIIQEAISSGPWGTPLPHGTHGHGPPQPAHVQAEAKGGGLAGQTSATRVDLSHGEFVVTPQDVLRIGAGDLKRGHRILDRFVEDERARQIKKLKALPGPVKSTHRGGRDTGAGARVDGRS